ncbi:sensor domain-containing diguanylate cyclase [Erwinia sp. 9145]|uniref:sensor domain-containing diguanylate cyclase n=1 Tax=Erwinia sp. 9145 TaxID=1500895 RepID=UPI0006922929|nr:sensor domain-containing diguanylate cyclase [Erwinia sp. 9145]
MSEEIRAQNDTSMLNLRKMLLIFLSVICVAVVLVNGWIVNNTWQRMLDDTQNNARNLSQSVSQQSEDSFLQVELVLQDLRDRITLIGLDGERQVYLHDLLSTRKASLPQLHGLFVYDANGDWVVTSAAEMPKKHFNNSDRDYFRYHMTHTDPGMLISKVIHSRSTGELIIPLSMRLNNSDGSFRGVLLATIRIDYFRQVFGYYTLGERGLMALISDKGNLFYARPSPDDTINRNLSSSPLFTHLLKESASGTAIYKAAIDGVERVFGYASMKRYPLVVTVGYGKQQLLQTWLTGVLVYIVLCILLLLAIVMLGYLLLRNLSKSIQNQRELAEVRDQLTQMNHALQNLALVDSLTGLANRRQFDLYLDSSLEQAERARSPVALLMIDVDSFKRFNDTYGHLAGDECLKRIASALQQVPHRADDLIARYGGEEFAVILPDSGRKGALRYAQAAVDAVALMNIPHESSDVAEKIVTISVGVHALEDEATNTSREALISEADKALYQAKTAGKNRVEML